MSEVSRPAGPVPGARTTPGLPVVSAFRNATIGGSSLRVSRERTTSATTRRRPPLQIPLGAGATASLDAHLRTSVGRALTLLQLPRTCCLGGARHEFDGPSVDLSIAAFDSWRHAGGTRVLHTHSALSFRNAAIHGVAVQQSRFRPSSPGGTPRHRIVSDVAGGTCRAGMYAPKRRGSSRRATVDGVRIQTAGPHPRRKFRMRTGGIPFRDVPWLRALADRHRHALAEVSADLS